MEKIQNFSDLASTPERRLCLDLASKALASIDMKLCLEKFLSYRNGVLFAGDKHFPLQNKKRVFVVAVGKCSGIGGTAIESILGERLDDGILIDCNPYQTKKMRSFVGTHPQVSKENVEATKELIEFLSQATKDDFILFLISGGGSTLLACPEGTSLEDENRIVNRLMQKGASIQQINVVRKHLSKARGGFLASYAYPAESVALYVSDVPHNDLTWVASGPTVFDPTTSEESKEILREFRLSESGIKWIETPTDQEPFSHVTDLCFLNNQTPLKAMAEEAKRQGYKAFIRSDIVEEDAERMARNLCRELKHCPPKTVVLYGGETTVSVRGEGRGGRNLHFSLTALPHLEEGELLLSLATDGQDHGPWAGAIVDWEAKQQAEQQGMNSEEYRLNCDSYSFFEQLPTYLVTGPTGSNVADLIIGIKSHHTKDGSKFGF